MVMERYNIKYNEYKILLKAFIIEQEAKLKKTNNLSFIKKQEDTKKLSPVNKDLSRIFKSW